MVWTELQDDPGASAFAAPGRWAWGICWLMFAATTLNYMDRQTVALLREPIRAEFGLNDAGFGWVMSAFLMTYAVFQLPAGHLVDRWDVRRTYAGAVVLWSLAGVATAFAPSLGLVLALRALLGVGESFNWPCALRVTGMILPPSERGLGNGIFNSGAAVGAVVAPLIVTPLAVALGWRTPFVVVGSLGFVWVAVWLAALGGRRRVLLTERAEKAAPGNVAVDRPAPTTAATLSTTARLTFAVVAATALVLAVLAPWLGAGAVWGAIAWLMFGTLLAARGLPEPALRGADWAESLGAVVRLRRFWVLVVVSISINVCWHFLNSWLPSYLKTDRGMSILAGGLWSAVPFLAADVGNLAGGAVARALVRRGLAPSRARIRVMSVCAVLATSGAWVGRVRDDMAVIALLAVMALGAAGFFANYFTFTQEVAPRHTGLIVGILGGLGVLSAAGFVPLAGWVKDTTGRLDSIFVVVGLLPILGLGALILGWGDEVRADRKPG